MLKLSLVQARTFWHQPEANWAQLEEAIGRLDEPGDLILLPEMFSTGFSMDTSQAEPQGLFSLKWMKQIAAATQALVLGSVMTRDGGSFFNRLFAVEPSGQVQTYDKRHLYRMGEENEHYTAGSKRLIIEWQGWRICPLVCYDLRFPVWSRNYSHRSDGNRDHAYDLLCYVACWPAKRADIWKSLTAARAIENQSYVAALSRTGDDGDCLPSSGNSRILDYQGRSLAELNAEEAVLQHTLSKAALEDFRLEFPAHLDGDRFRIDP